MYRLEYSYPDIDCLPYREKYDNIYELLINIPFNPTITEEMDICKFSPDGNSEKISNYKSVDNRIITYHDPDNKVAIVLNENTDYVSRLINSKCVEAFYYIGGYYDDYIHWKIDEFINLHISDRDIYIDLIKKQVLMRNQLIDYIGDYDGNFTDFICNGSWEDIKKLENVFKKIHKKNKFYMNFKIRLYTIDMFLMKILLC